MNEQIAILEQMRKKAKNSTGLVVLCIAGCALIGMFTMHFGLILVGVVLGIICYVAVAKKSNKEYKEYYKNVFVKNMIKSVIPDAVYEPRQGFEKDRIRATGLMMMGNIYASEDYIRGTYNNVAFERADVVIQDESTDSDGNTTTTTYLRGRWMIFESNKNFDADLQILQKGFGYANKRKGFFTKKADRRHAFKTEDETFNKTFECLCQNESEAFYLLTPGVMQALLRLIGQTDGKVMVGFVDNQLHVVVKSNKNSLEPPFWRTFNENDLNEVQREINAITGFVESLNLDRKIFK